MLKSVSMGLNFTHKLRASCHRFQTIETVRCVSQSSSTGTTVDHRQLKKPCQPTFKLSVTPVPFYPPHFPRPAFLQPSHVQQNQPRLFSTQIVARAETGQIADATAAAQKAAEGAAQVATTPSEAASLDGKVELLLEAIPEKPLPLAEAAASLGEPSLESLGLCSYWPPGRIQWVLESVHVDLGLPWWQSVMLLTLCLRLVLFPLVLRSQRNAAKMSRVMPQMQVLQEKMTEARQRGDEYEAAEAGMEIQKYSKKHNLSPFSSVMPMLIQIPVFVSVFMGLRGMASLPVESMETGGILWFTDLTLRDPYYALPLLTSTTVFLQLKFATDGISLDTISPTMKKVAMCMPVLIVPMTVGFPSAITLYWCTSNIISLAQAKILRTTYLREKLKIGKIMKKPKAKSEKKKEGVIKGLRNSWENTKVQAAAADRRRYDEEAFRNAGLERPKRTYRFDPTRPTIKKD